MESLVAMLTQQAESQKLVMLELKKLVQQQKNAAVAAPAAPITPALPPKNKRSMIEDEKPVDVSPCNTPPNSPRKKRRRSPRLKKRGGKKLKRSLSFQEAVRAGSRKKKSPEVRVGLLCVMFFFFFTFCFCLSYVMCFCFFSFCQDADLRTRLRLKLCALDKRLFRGDFHFVLSNRLRKDTFLAAVGPIITDVIGDEFEDEELPNKAMDMVYTHTHT